MTAAEPAQAAPGQDLRELPVPALSLVVLVGATGSGKSTFARARFASTEVLSSDTFRGMVADDENDQAATADAFEVLHLAAAKRLAAGRLTVVDATNVQPEARRSLVALARDHDVLPVAIVLDLPERVCARRNADRPDRRFGPQVLRRQRDQLRRGLRGLGREGFRTVHVLREEAEVDAARIARTRLYSDLRDRTGPFDVIGDVHGCLDELVSLLGSLGWEVTRDDAGRPVGAHHPHGRQAVFLGDLVDRGPDSPGVLRLVMAMVADGTALCVPGNHENRLVRALDGRQVQPTHGLPETLAQLAGQDADFRAAARAFLDGLVSHLVLDGGALVVSHAGLPERYQGRASRRVREFCLYGATTGATDSDGLPVRLPWAADYRGAATVLYGHVPTPGPEWVNNTLCLDTGCVFGGRLSALRWPERELVSVPAERVWFEPPRPFPPAGGEPGAVGTDAAAAAAPAGATPHREPSVLAITDVAGRRVVETAHRGRVSVREENAAAALEVMTRFALDPRWLVYLPPTMSPVATSSEPDLLEHPAQAFEAYRAEGVERVVCQEKHMGSRAVVLLCRDASVARARFGTDGARAGAIWTRTGRAFLDRAGTDAVLDRVRRAAQRAGVFDELDSGWLLLDAELLPWSAKAGPLLRGQYAAVGAAARGSLPVAVELLQRAAARGPDIGALLSRTAARRADADAFTAAYRRYCWPTDGPAGLALAPFQVLAAEGASFADRRHDWHLDVVDRLVAADAAAGDSSSDGAGAAAGSTAGDPANNGALLRSTRRIGVDTGDPDSVAAGTAWWQDLTDAGGEGMVVKPAGNLTRGRHGLVQPGLKVRGREYLRIVYGPDYTEPANLVRLRDRGLGHKRSLALREYALGLEALERLARGEPLWRVHEAVFAVLALESEPVDPRL